MVSASIKCPRVEQADRGRGNGEETPMRVQSNPAPLPTNADVDAVRDATWAGVNASDELELRLNRALDALQLKAEQVGLLTIFADSLATAATELAGRAERIRLAVIDSYTTA
jgi:hypothetical protein